MYYYSSKAYEFARQYFTLPIPRTIRNYMGTIDCYPGFQDPAFEELLLHKGDITFSDASLCIDAMSVKESIQFHQKLGKCFGYVDQGGQSSNGDDLPANESLVVMAVGLISSWKLPFAYFLIRAVNSGILTGIIRESLKRCFEAGVTIRTCMDGTNTNISAFKIPWLQHCSRKSLWNVNWLPPSEWPATSICHTWSPSHVQECKEHVGGIKRACLARCVVKWSYLVKVHKSKNSMVSGLANHLPTHRFQEEQNEGSPGYSIVLGLLSSIPKMGAF